MSEENVEFVQGIVDAHQRGDFATVFAAYDPAIEWRTGDARTAQWSDFEPVYHGHEGVRTFWRTWFAAWETVDFEYEEFIDAGDQVLSILSQRMRGRTSGVELEWNSYAQVWTIRDGKVIRVQFFANRDEALEAAGLSE
jgi:ketosteroid isomerase-like protein